MFRLLGAFLLQQRHKFPNQNKKKTEKVTKSIDFIVGRKKRVVVPSSLRCVRECVLRVTLKINFC